MNIDCTCAWLYEHEIGPKMVPTCWGISKAGRDPLEWHGCRMNEEVTRAKPPRAGTVTPPESAVPRYTSPTTTEPPPPPGK